MASTAQSIPSLGRPARIRKRSLWTVARQWLTLPLVLWALLWLAIDTGPWNLHFGGGVHGMVNAVRASFPLVVLTVAAIALLARSGQRRPTLVEGSFWIYGLVMFVSSFQVHPWFDYAYWAFAFLATLAATQLALARYDSVRVAQKLNWASWLIATAALLTLLIVARDLLFANSALSGYGIVNRAKTVGGVPMSRASGLSRMAAVPATVALVYVFRGRWWQRFGALMVFSGAFFIIWIMQSRGSLFAFLGAFAFVLCLGGPQARRVGVVAALLLVALWLGEALSGGVLHQLWEHATRSTGSSGFHTMSGRPEIWHHAWKHIQQFPLIGHGPQADRQFSDVGNAQNAVVYALLNTGFLGTSFFVLGMAAAWASLAGLLKRFSRLTQHERFMVTVTGALLAFNTLRSIPENNAALFSIDLLLQYPAMVYLAVLHRSVKRRQRGRRRFVPRGFARIPG